MMSGMIEKVMYVEGTSMRAFLRGEMYRIEYQERGNKEIM